jgi:tight adherence protein C
MPGYVIFAIATVSLALPLFAWAMFARPSRESRRAVTNLHRGLEVQSLSGRDARRQSAGRRWLRQLTRRLTPTSSVRRLDRLLARAGRPEAWPMERLLAAKLVLPVVFGLLSVLYADVSPGTLAALVGVTVTVVSYFLPELLLHSQGQKRSEQIGLELPDTLDQMTIAVESGLGFDSAMARAGKSGKGPLAVELMRTLQDIQVGQSRRQAYEALAARILVPDLRKFVRAIVQADAYGIPIAEVLRTQASEMRIKRRQRAEAKAMQIPVKVVFPLMLCILPVLFIVLLGPAAMDIAAAFK